MKQKHRLSALIPIGAFCVRFGTHWQEASVVDSVVFTTMLPCMATTAGVWYKEAVSAVPNPVWKMTVLSAYDELR